MIVGDPATFALECEITEVYDLTRQIALGFFVIYVLGRRYGIKKPDASMLGNSYDEVKRRLAERGTHRFSTIERADAVLIADAVLAVEYQVEREHELFFGMSFERFSATVDQSKIKWAPDGDEAFDDDSFVIQIDVDDKVRLIAFRDSNDRSVTGMGLSDITLDAYIYYDSLSQFLCAFRGELSRKGMSTN